MTHSHDTATPALSVERAAGISIEALQAAHVARQEEWCPDQKPDLSFRGNEMAGEVGEACNVIKKLERERQGWRGSRATVDDLGDELADVIHTAILCSITAGIELGPRVVAKFNATSEKNGLATTLAAAPALNPSPAAKGGEAEAVKAILEWYSRTVENCRKLTSDGNAAREALDRDGGSRAKEALAKFVALATLSPQPIDAVREALFSAWELDELRQNASAKHLVYLAHHAAAGLKADEIEAMERWGALCNKLAALASDPAPAGEAVEPIEKHRIANRLRGMFDMAVASEDDFNRLSPAGFRLLRQAHDALISPEDTARLREDLERVREAGLISEQNEALAVEAAQRAERDRDDAQKALETVREDLGLFRDFVINNATVWVAGSGHHHPMWGRIAAHLEGYESPRAGEKWPLVRPADTVAARSTSREGASDE